MIHRTGPERRLILLLAVAVACVPAEQKAKSPIESSSIVHGVDSSVTLVRSTALSAASAPPDSLVHPASIGPVVSAACDSAAAIVRGALSLETARKEGDYHDSFRGASRTGCRLTAQGSFKALPKDGGPVDLLYPAFMRHGWRPDGHFSADGPDGSAVGMRRRDILCIVNGSWDGGDDSDTVARAPTPEEDIYEIIVECARAVPSNAEAEVPDSIWSIAAKAGLDSIYAISLALRIPPYQSGDFDGDGVADAAVLIENRTTGKLGMAIVHRGTRKVTVLAAGSGSAGPDDLDGLREWEAYYKGSTPNLAIQVPPNASLIGDALWVAGDNSPRGFYIWNGTGFFYESHRK